MFRATSTVLRPQDNGSSVMQYRGWLIFSFLSIAAGALAMENKKTYAPA
jgi:hypothetical protein